jgi:hypothetical protein
VTDDWTVADYEAAAAARDADRVNTAIVISDPVGECPDCDARFVYGTADQRQLDPCPECGSHDWTKWGYDHPDHGRVPLSEIDDGALGGDGDAD